MTLTADTFSGMRQAIQTTMDVDMDCQPVGSTDPGMWMDSVKIH